MFDTLMKISIGMMERCNVIPQIFPETVEDPEMPLDTVMIACDMRAANPPGGPFPAVEDMLEVGQFL